MNLKPGRELDALVAEKVMGWKRVKPDYLKPEHRPSLDYPGYIIDNWENRGPHDYLYPPYDNGDRHHRVAFCGCESDLELPHYSTDIAVAFEMMEKIRSESRLYDFELWVMGDDEWGAEFSTNKTYKAWAESAAHAICLAALKTVGINYETT